MASTFLTSLLAVEPQIHIPTFFKPKPLRKSPDLATEQRLSRLDQSDRYLRLIRHNNAQWLRRRGKAKYTGFSPSQRQQMKLFFQEIDEEKTGAITIDELMEPLLALGVARTKEEVLALFHRPANDPVPIIDFEEFEAVLEAAHISRSRLDSLLRNFLQPSPLPFKLRISSLRRKVMMQAYTSASPEKRETGRAVLKFLADELSSSHTPIEKSSLLVRKKLLRISSPHHRDSPNVYRRAKTAAGLRVKPQIERPASRLKEIGMDMNISALI